MIYFTYRCNISVCSNKYKNRRDKMRIEYIDTNKRKMSKKDFIEWVNRNKKFYKNEEN